VKFRFIEEHLCSQFPVEACCEVPEVSRSGYYARRERRDSARAKRREEPAEKVREVHEHNRGVYGSPRVFRALKAGGEGVCENTVARVMRDNGIRARSKRKYVPRTTDSAHEQPVAPNVLGR
jgi:putative transposase